MTTYCSVGVFQISRKAFNATHHSNLYHPNYALLRKSARFLYLYLTLVSSNFSRMPKIFGVCKKNTESCFNVTRIWNTRTHPHCPSYFYYVCRFLFWNILAFKWIGTRPCVLYSWQMMNWTKFLHIHYVDILICKKTEKKENTRYAKKTQTHEMRTESRSALDKKIRLIKLRVRAAPT